MHSGYLNIDKPRGYSSHDIVNHIRRLTGERRVGHAGTLDPLASGVLVLCLGQATRLSEYVAEGRKTYLARLRLGQATTTYDGEGEVTATSAWGHLIQADLERSLAPFRGEIQQVPPMYSAVKHHGKALYKFARRGITIEREARGITIDSCEIVTWEPPSTELRITCSGGTYIRTLAHDIGQALGVGAYLANLVRERSGAFTLADAVAMDTLNQAGRDDWQRYLLPMQVGLSHLSGVTVDAAQETEIRNGRTLAIPELPPTELAYALTSAGQLFAILRYRADIALWQPAKVFNT